ncbi:MAG TPA: ABC transporter ATP-binding protein [Candidatus Cybelea sp.]|nr:ABC transporter ATP-binding protein [Candidatus Cybelea sp.]
MIELRDVTLGVGGRALLEEVDARIAAGDFVAVLGRNGAGKTTLLRAIAGLHPARRGSVLLDGTPIDQLAPLERAKRVAFVTGDEVFLEALLVRDVVSIGRYAHHRWWQWNEEPQDEAAIEGALAAVGASRFAQRLFSTLSAGERQRVWIALGLAQETPILLLDEPTSHLDVGAAADILALLRGLSESGKTIVCALHDVNEAATYADRIALLGENRLLALDAPPNLLEGPLLQRAYGIAFKRVPALLPTRSPAASSQPQSPSSQAQSPTS